MKQNVKFIEVDINKLSTNEHNPRVIYDKEFEELCNSIAQFPKMLQIRPLVVDEDFVILGGNMRFEAVKKLGWEKVPVAQFIGLDVERKREFIIKDNVEFGDWDWDELYREFKLDDLKEWGIQVWVDEDEVVAMKEREATIVPGEKPETVYYVMCPNCAEEFKINLDGETAD